MNEADALFDLIVRRRSAGLSRMSERPVDRAVVERMLEAANWAPSHEDTEPWRFTVFAGEGREELARIWDKGDGAGRKRAFAAPVWISIGMSPGLDENGSPLMTPDEEIMAVACAVQNLHLMATAYALTGMWHSKGLSVAPETASALGLDAPGRLLGFFMLGHPGGELPQAGRRPLEEKVRWA